MITQVLTCTAFDTEGVCTATQYAEAYLLPSDSAPMLGLLLSGGFDPEYAQVGFIGIMSLFAAGLTVGIIILMIRKLRTP